MAYSFLRVLRLLAATVLSNESVTPPVWSAVVSTPERAQARWPTCQLLSLLNNLSMVRNRRQLARERFPSWGKPPPADEPRVFNLSLSTPLAVSG